MADFYLDEVTVTYEGGKAAVTAFHKALDLRESEAVEETLEYLEGQSFKVDRKKHTFYASAWCDLIVPNALGPLVHEFPGITFTFDLCYHDFFWWSKYLDGADSLDYYRDFKDRLLFPQGTMAGQGVFCQSGTDRAETVYRRSIHKRPRFYEGA